MCELNPGKNVVRAQHTMPMVASVLTVIQIMVFLKLPVFSGSRPLGGRGGSSSAFSTSLPASTSSSALTFTKPLAGLLLPPFSSWELSVLEGSRSRPAMAATNEEGNGRASDFEGERRRPMRWGKPRQTEGEERRVEYRSGALRTMYGVRARESEVSCKCERASEWW